MRNFRIALFKSFPSLAIRSGTASNVPSESFPSRITSSRGGELDNGRQLMLKNEEWTGGGKPPVASLVGVKSSRNLFGPGPS